MDRRCRFALSKPDFFLIKFSICRKFGMTKFFYSILMLILVFSFATCASRRDTTRPPDIRVEKPEPPVYIMSKGLISGEQMSVFLLQNNPQINPSYIRALSLYYIEEAAYEGVNHDIAFAQMCLETGYLRFGNLVTPDQNNFAGLGATGLPGPDGTPDKGLYFPEPRIGVRAHVQHLKAYASTEPLNGELVNPRRRFVRLGSSPTVEGLAGTWAADRQYAVKINAILERLYDSAF